MNTPEPIYLQILEAFSHLADVGLFAAALYGLKQLRISKNTAHIAAKRDALKLSNDQVKYYLETIIPMQNALHKELDANDVKLTKESTVKVVEGKVKVELRPKNKAEVQKVFELKNDIKTLNAMEAFASYLVSGAADEKTAFTAIGKAYCFETKRFLPLVALFNSGETDKDEYYKNIVSLYAIWQSRFQEMNLHAEKESIEKKLKEINSTDIIALGTSDKDI